jgi:hypothetical protein
MKEKEKEWMRVGGGWGGSEVVREGKKVIRIYWMKKR